MNREKCTCCGTLSPELFCGGSAGGVCDACHSGAPGFRTGGCYPATPSPAAVMLLSKPDTPASEPLPPYIHAKWVASRCMGGQIVPQHVQVKQGPITLCGQIVDAWSLDGGGDFWKLRLLDGIVRSVGVNRTVQCSGLDGRCSCAGERATNLVAAQ